MSFFWASNLRASGPLLWQSGEFSKLSCKFPALLTSPIQRSHFWYLTACACINRMKYFDSFKQNLTKLHFQMKFLLSTNPFILKPKVIFSQNFWNSHKLEMLLLDHVSFGFWPKGTWVSSDCFKPLLIKSPYSLLPEHLSAYWCSNTVSYTQSMYFTPQIIVILSFSFKKYYT